MVRIAILGLGRIGRMHADLLAFEVEDAEVVVVADTVESAVTHVSERLGVPGTTEPRTVLDRDDVDAVAVCTPTPTHAEFVIGAAKAGKAVFCEKPLSLDLAETDTALRAVSDAGVVFQVGFNRRFDAGHAAVHEAVARGDVGAPELARISSRDPAPPGIDYLRTSGGIFLDQTIHDFDMARYVTGSEVVEVQATGAVRVNPAIADIGDLDTVAITLRHDNDCLTLIDNSRRAVYGYDQRVEVFGSAGMAASDNLPAHGAVVRTADAARGAPLPWFYLERYRASYIRQWTAFVDVVKGGTPVGAGGADARAALVVGLAAGESATAGRLVPVNLESG